MSSEQWEAAISHLTKQTESGEVQWEPVPSAKRHCTLGERVLGIPYRAEVLTKTFFVYQYEYRYFHEPDEWTPASEVAIEIVTENFELEFRVPEVGARWDLLNAIREQASGAKDFLDEFLRGT